MPGKIVLLLFEHQGLMNYCFFTLNLFDFEHHLYQLRHAYLLGFDLKKL